MTVNGAKHYLWRAVDHEREVLENFVTQTRDRKVVLKLLKKSMGNPPIFSGVQS